MNGMTLKQFGRVEFFEALSEYRKALEINSGLVAASLRIHAAKGGVPKSYWRLVSQVRKQVEKARLA